MLFTGIPPRAWCAIPGSKNLCHWFKRQKDDDEEAQELHDATGGDEVVLNGYGAGVERTEEDGEAEDEFEALLSKTMSESVEKTKIARATTQVHLYKKDRFRCSVFVLDGSLLVSRALYVFSGAALVQTRPFSVCDTFSIVAWGG